MNKMLLVAAVSSVLATPMTAAAPYAWSAQLDRALLYPSADPNRNLHRVGHNPAADAPHSHPDNGDRRNPEIRLSGAWGALSFGQGHMNIDAAGAWWPPVRPTAMPPVRGIFNHGSYPRDAALGDPHDYLNFYPAAPFASSDRTNRVRYDSPAIGPLTLQTGFNGNDHWDITGRINTAAFGGDLEAAAFYTEETPPTADADGTAAAAHHRYGGSFAYAFSQGTNFSFTYAQRSTSEDPGESPNPDTISFFLGHNLSHTEIGIGYGISDDIEAGFEASIWHIGISHNLPQANMDLYAGYRLHQLNTSSKAEDADDLHAITIGMRLTFD